MIPHEAGESCGGIVAIDTAAQIGSDMTAGAVYGVALDARLRCEQSLAALGTWRVRALLRAALRLPER